MLEIIRFITHYGMHFVLPFFIALYFYKPKYIKVYFIFLLTMLVDLDHFLATPVFDATRCSIGFHPLHSYWAIAVYVLLLIPKRTRIPAIGLVLHMLTDWLDCFWIG